MKTQMLPRNNSRCLPTLDPRKGVTIRQVSEAYGCTEKDNKPISRQDLIYYSIWALFTVGMIVLSITTYPPSKALMLVEILISVLFSGGLFIFKAMKL